MKPGYSPRDSVSARKYAALCRKYEELVRKLEDRRLERTGVWTLSRWAITTSESALTILRRGSVVIANDRWTRLEARGAKSGRKWRILGDPSRTFDSLRQLAVEESARLDAGERARVLRLKREGLRFRLEMRLERLADDDGGDVAALVHDVTERTARERELAVARRELIRRERLRAIGELASGVAHDLNNTFNALLLRVKLLQMHPKCEDEDLRVRIEPISKIVLEASSTVARLQDFARRRRDLPTGTVELGAVVQETVEFAGPQLQRKAAISLETKIAEPIPVRGCPVELGQLMLNLLLNARDAMPEGGRIVIEAGHNQRGVVLRVLDEGTGIKPRHLKRIFDPFFTTKGTRGTGLGLSTAYATMRRLGGSISASNRREGGAAFTLRFPATGPEIQPAPSVTDETPVVPRRILVVDDDDDNRTALLALLEVEGHQVDAVPSGDAAVETVRTGHRFDLVLCDLGMPGMDGWTVAQRIAQLAPTTPFWLLTGWGRDVERADRPEVRGVLEKPVDLRRLREVLAGTGS